MIPIFPFQINDIIIFLSVIFTGNGKSCIVFKDHFRKSSVQLPFPNESLAGLLIESPARKLLCRKRRRQQGELLIKMFCSSFSMSATAVFFQSFYLRSGKVLLLPDKDCFCYDVILLLLLCFNIVVIFKQLKAYHRCSSIFGRKMNNSYFGLLKIIAPPFSANQIVFGFSAVNCLLFSPG